ncbi:hypothetical protein [Thermanaerovibrio acidaminovorans]|jgi:hypothetical protein|uniref:hypothetical protein n=1 Tax=Thermanaerovibrio acidaminovorans TaxID=81462 RepID=UPI00249375A7|nr:hypothetical protein [Thermanaerovibrio acidaminovorans]
MIHRRSFSFPWGPLTLGILLLLAPLGGLPAMGVAFLPSDHQGYMIYKGPNGAQSYRIYVSSKGVRIDAQGAVDIYRPDLGVVWRLNGGDKTYQELRYQDHPGYFSLDGVPGTTGESYLGEELVGGVRCSKFLVSRTVGGIRENLVKWVSSKTGLLVKVADRYNRWSMEIRDIKEGPLPEGLFQLPKGYVKAEG